MNFNNQIITVTWLDLGSPKVTPMGVVMTKYRIRKTKTNTSFLYYIQEKFLWFWLNLCSDLEGRNIKYFDTVEETELQVQKQISYENRLKFKDTTVKVIKSK